jgi:hypothetical protein
MEFATYNDPAISQLSDGVWTPSGDNVTSQVTGKIYDAKAIPRETRGQLARIDLSIIPEENQHYWRIPTEIAPILAYLLFQLTSLPLSDCKEVRLAKQLGAMLILRFSSLKSSRVIGDAPTDPDGGGSKRGREDDDDDDDSGPRKRRSVKARMGRKKGGKSSVNQDKKMGEYFCISCLIWRFTIH